MKLEINQFFEAAHQLPDSEDLVSKKCCNLHGHTYKVKIVLSGKVEKSGMVVDFGIIKNIISELDHKFLNDIFGKIPTTAENIAKWIYSRVLTTCKIDKERIGMWEVFVCEGYKGDKNSSWVIYNGE